MKLLPSVLLAACLAACACAEAASYHVIICGSGGEAEYVKKFADWGTRLHDALVDRCGADPGHVTLLLENAPPGRQSTLEDIRAAFAALGPHCTPEDQVWVYLIGHGSFRRNISKLNVPGPDLAAEDLDALLAALPAEHAIVVNASSSSAGFVNVLSGPGRVICSATKDVDQRNATEFMEFFIQALEKGGADQDRDGRISILEACNHAAALTAAWYVDEHLIATENAILDDDGDGFGTRLPITSKEGDGQLARTLFLKDYLFPEGTSSSAVETYRDALSAVERFKARKSELQESLYYAELERLLIEAARAHRAIRNPGDEASTGGESAEPS